MIGEIPAPETPPERHTSRGLPPYRYVPGLHPHPFRHPDGHQWCGGGPPAVAPWSDGPWQRDEAFLYGVDLFNHRFPWEAHEAWEGIWTQLPGGDARRELLQGLIQGAAARLTRHLGRAAAARSLEHAALRRLGAAEALGGAVVHGIEVAHARAVLMSAAWDVLEVTP